MASDTLINEPGKNGKKMGGRMMNIVLVIAVIVVGGFLVRAEMQRKAVEKNLQVTQQELEKAKESSTTNGQAQADAILAKVRMLIDVPTVPAPAVQVIADVEALRKTNDFFKKAENGDSIVITQDRAILYSPVKNIIIDVVPVVQASPTPAVSGAPVESPKASPKATN